MSGNLPLISVGIPTRNRASLLKRAVESVLAQTYENLELVISDNGSKDETQEFCESLAKTDSRVRYLRQTVDRGLTANFLAVLKQSRGRFFMWLADDDWVEPEYARQCSIFLMDNPEYTLACGQGKYFENDRYVFNESAINLLEESPGERVLNYYRQVGINGAFYGLMKRELLADMTFDNALGGDWLIVARMAFLGKVKTLDSVAINRSVAGSSGNLEQLGLDAGLRSFIARRPHLYASYAAFRDIAWRSKVYGSLGWLSRLWLGVRAAGCIANRYVVPPFVSELFARVGRIRHWLNRLRSRLIIRTRFKRGLQALQGRGRPH